MASLQARHVGACSKGTAWSTFAAAPNGCSCPGGPTYYMVVRQGRRLHRERVGKNRQAAERALRKIAGQVDEGGYQAQRAIRFSEWAESWIGSLERKPTTIGNYRSTIAYAIEVFGQVQVRPLGVEHIVDFGRLLSERELAPSTRAKHLRVLGACLNSAIAHGYAVKNPVKMLPKSEKPRPEKREAAYFEKSEITPLIQAYSDGVYRMLTRSRFGPGCARASSWRSPGAPSISMKPLRESV